MKARRAKKRTKGNVRRTKKTHGTQLLKFVEDGGSTAQKFTAELIEKASSIETWCTQYKQGTKRMFEELAAESQRKRIKIDDQGNSAPDPESSEIKKEMVLDNENLVVPQGKRDRSEGFDSDVTDKENHQARSPTDSPNPKKPRTSAGSASDGSSSAAASIASSVSPASPAITAQSLTKEERFAELKVRGATTIKELKAWLKLNHVEFPSKQVKKDLLIGLRVDYEFEQRTSEEPVPQPAPLSTEKIMVTEPEIVEAEADDVVMVPQKDADGVEEDVVDTMATDGAAAAAAAAAEFDREEQENEARIAEEVQRQEEATAELARKEEEETRVAAALKQQQEEEEEAHAQQQLLLQQEEEKKQEQERLEQEQLKQEELKQEELKQEELKREQQRLADKERLQTLEQERLAEQEKLRQEELKREQQRLADKERLQTLAKERLDQEARKIAALKEEEEYKAKQAQLQEKREADRRKAQEQENQRVARENAALKEAEEYDAKQAQLQEKREAEKRKAQEQEKQRVANETKAKIEAEAFKARQLALKVNPAIPKKNTLKNLFPKAVKKKPRPIKKTTSKKTGRVQQMADQINNNKTLGSLSPAQKPSKPRNRSSSSKVPDAQTTAALEAAAAKMDARAKKIKETMMSPAPSAPSTSEPNPALLVTPYQDKTDSASEGESPILEGVHQSTGKKPKSKARKWATGSPLKRALQQQTQNIAMHTLNTQQIFGRVLKPNLCGKKFFVLVCVEWFAKMCCRV